MLIFFYILKLFNFRIFSTFISIFISTKFYEKIGKNKILVKKLSYSPLYKSKIYKID